MDLPGQRIELGSSARQADNPTDHQEAPTVAEGRVFHVLCFLLVVLLLKWALGLALRRPGVF